MRLLALLILCAGATKDVAVVDKEPPPTQTKTLAAAQDAGEVIPTSTYLYSDGGYVSRIDLPDGGMKVTKVDHSPCAWRPKGVSAKNCSWRLRDGGTRDTGDEVVLQTWAGASCVEKPCVVMQGEVLK